jgi:protein CpxP
MMNKLALGVAGMAMLISGACLAQTSGGNAAASGNDNQAVATTNANAPQPAHGANSFTMAQARTRMEKDGYQNVTGLRKDKNGVWHAKAQKDGTQTMVWLDYKGNVGQSQ